MRKSACFSASEEKVGFLHYVLRIISSYKTNFTEILCHLYSITEHCWYNF